MAGVPPSAYVPPHRRNKTPATTDVVPVQAPKQASNDGCAVKTETSNMEKSMPVQKAEQARKPTECPKKQLPPSPPTTSTPAGKATGDVWGGWNDNQPTPSTRPEKKVENIIDAVWGDWGEPQPTRLVGDALQHPPSPPPAKKIEKAIDNDWGDWGEPHPNGWNTWSDPQPTPPIESLKKTHNPRWPSRGTAPARKTQWVKARDLKPLPSADEESNGGVSFKSDSNGDPNYDVRKLMDWNGDWMPPPVEWMERHPFADRHFGASIERWINTHDASCIHEWSGRELHSPEYLGIEVDGEYLTVDGKKVNKVITKDLVPRTWVPVRIEGEAPQQFWRDFSSRAPAALSDVDLGERVPYWCNYDKDMSNCFLAPPEAPEATMDPNDEQSKHMKASMSASDAVTHLLRWRMKRARKLEEKKARLIPSAPIRGPPPVLSNAIYLRPVHAADAEDIQEIYNHYVENSISTPEFQPRQLHHIINRMNTVTSEKLPFIVAIDRTDKQRRGRQQYVRDRVVGFASMEDFCSKGSMYRFTMEMELFVHPAYTRKGIARCLLDRLISTVSTSYVLKGGYEWINHGEYLKNDAERVVKTINFNVPHETKDDTEWMTKLLKEYQFVKAGHFKQMGAKKGKIVDVTIYQHVTSEVIQPNHTPVNPL